MTNLERRKVLYFCLRFYKKNVLYKAFTRNISAIVTNHVKAYPKCFSFGILLQKLSSWFSSCTVKYISPERHNFHFSNLHMESEPCLIFKIISSEANLNLRTKFESFSIVNSQEKELKKNYTLLIMWVSNLSFMQILSYGKRKQTLK